MANAGPKGRMPEDTPLITPGTTFDREVTGIRATILFRQQTVRKVKIVKMAKKDSLQHSVKNCAVDIGFREQSLFLTISEIRPLGCGVLLAEVSGDAC
jgi:hypothetical protein